MINRSRKKNNIPRLIHRREQWTLTMQGWAVVLISIAIGTILTITNVQPFLASNYPVQADTLVIEGWLPDYALKQAINEFKNGGYRQIVTTGGPLDPGFYLAEYKTYAELAAATLKTLEVPEEKVIAVPAPEVNKDRTYASAIAFRQWLLQSSLPIKSINVYTFDVHARRSWLLFKKILEPQVSTGVIAVQAREYQPDNWWVSSAGVRSIISEAIAYIYARFVNYAN